MTGGDFRIHGRLILGNDVDCEDDNGAPMKNTADAGAAMYKTGGTARYGGYNHLTYTWSGLTDIPLTDTYFSDFGISYFDGAWAPYN
ncbi:MAG: hypothetical protein FWG99_03720 [Treponema sp.]|nr:hypothetical protein [Treponema sp.]